MSTFLFAISIIYAILYIMENTKEKQQIKNFFPTFDFVYPIDETTVILANKNTLAGIYEFEVENSLIKNIKQC